MDKRPSGKKGGHVYKFKEKNAHIEHKKTVKREFPKGSLENDENDIDLMMIFGMEGEAQSKNPEQYNKVKEELQEQQKIKGKQEYLVKEQTEEFVKKYEGLKKSARSKFIPNLLILVFSVLFELLVFYNDSLFEKIAVLYHSAITPLVALQAVVLLCALNYRRYIKGFGIFWGRASHDSLFSISATFLALYHIFLAAVGMLGISDGVAVYNLYLTPIALLGMFIGFSDYLDGVKNLSAFKTVSAKGQKYVLRVSKKGSSRQKALSTDGGDIISVAKTDFVEDFVKRTDSVYKNGVHIKWIAIASIVVSAGVFVYKYITAGNIVEALSSFIMTMMFTMPFSVCFSYSVIFARASRLAAKKNCAIVGQSAFLEYPSSTAVYFDDTSVFPPKKTKLKGFRAYGDTRIDKLLYIMAGIYKKLDSPAYPIFEKSIGNFKEEFNIDILDVAQNGVRVAVEGSTVFVGELEYMRDCGFEPEDALAGKNNDPMISVVYMALGHSVVLKAYIEYNLDVSIPETAELLKANGMYLGICTCDPCINDAMMNLRIPLEKYPVGIMKSTKDKNDKYRKKVSGGIVSLTGEGGLLKALLCTVRASHAFRTDMIMKFFAFLAGAVLSLLFTVFAADSGVGMWFLVFFQLIAAIPTFFILSGMDR